MTNVKFFTNSQKINISYIARISPQSKGFNKPALVFLSGYRSNMFGTKASYLSQVADKHDYDYLRFDYRGCGESQGNFIDQTLTDWIQDSYEIIHHIFKEKTKIILVGSSMGAWIALKLLPQLKDKICGFIGLAPAADFTSKLMGNARASDFYQKQLSDKGYVLQKCDHEGDDFIITRKFLDDGDKQSVLDDTISFDGAVHLIQGMKDAEVPYHHTLLTAERMSSDNIIIELLKSSDHRLSSVEDLLHIENAIHKMIRNYVGDLMS